MAGIHTGKQKAQRIDLAYHRRTDPFRSWRSYLTVVAVVGALGYAAFGLFAGPAGEYQFTHGPLSAPHAHIDRDCGACHEPFAPIRDDSFLSKWLESPRRCSENRLPPDRGGGVSDTKCAKCHQETLGHHGQLSKAEDITSCASCHVEHRGRDVDVALSTDLSCLRCHDKLDDHRLPLSAELKSGGGQADRLARGAVLRRPPNFRSIETIPENRRRIRELCGRSPRPTPGKGNFERRFDRSPHEVEGCRATWRDRETGGRLRRRSCAAGLSVVPCAGSGIGRQGGRPVVEGGRVHGADHFCEALRGLPSAGFAQGSFARTHRRRGGVAVEGLPGGRDGEGRVEVGRGQETTRTGDGDRATAESAGSDRHLVEVFQKRQSDAQNKCAKCHQYEPATGNTLPEIQPRRFRRLGWPTAASITRPTRR